MAPRKSTATPLTVRSHKRQLSASATPATATPGSRASKRLKESANNTPTNAKTTPKKSKYFEGSDSDDEEAAVPTSEDVSESGYEDQDEDQDVSATEPSASELESEEEDASDSDEKPAKKRGGKTATAKGKGGAQKTGAVNKDLWREGVKTGLGPGKQVFIAKPKPRDEGGIKYVPERIHPNTMAFLADLKKNNDREWLKLNDPDYRKSWKDWESFIESLTEKISEKDETIPELPPKDLVFRIYRDVRFSSDPTPYKTHFSAAWSRTGRKGPYAAYYVQIQPGGQSFVGSGLWMPEAQPLALLREDVDRHSERLKRVLMNPGIRKSIFGGVGNDEKKVVKAFTSQNNENALKTKPKGYEADNANIDLLRLKNYTMGRRLKDEEVLNPKGLETILDLIGTMTPFVTYLNSVVMPDDDEDDDDDGDEEAGSDSSENESDDV